MKSRSVSLFEAKTHFSALIASVHERKEEIVVTKHGHIVAKIVPADDKASVNDAIAAMLDFGTKMKTSKVTLADIQSMKNEGRK